VEQTKKDDEHMDFISRHVDSHVERGTTLQTDPYPFGTMFYTPIDRLKFALYTKSQIEWDNFLKGRTSRDWISCIDHHFQETGSKLTG
jgi:hypothetical protein